MSDALVTALGLATNARLVILSVRTRRHIVARRRLVSRSDSLLCIRYLSEALHNPIGILVPQRDPRVFEIVGFIPSANRHVLVAIKLVPAEASKGATDEWWVRTAHPFGKRVMRKKDRCGLLRRFKGAVQQAVEADGPDSS